MAAPEFCRHAADVTAPTVAEVLELCSTLKPSLHPHTSLGMYSYVPHIVLPQPALHRDSPRANLQLTTTLYFLISRFFDSLFISLITGSLEKERQT